MIDKFPGRRLTAAEANQYNLTLTSLLTANDELKRHELRGRYRSSADRGDNPNYKGLLDRNRVDRDEAYEVQHFIKHFCQTLGISARIEGLEVERLLLLAPSNMVMRDQLQNWVWTQLISPARRGLLSLIR